MKVMITGGAGYIGYSLVNALEELEEIKEVVVYDNLTHHNANFFFYGPKLKKCRFVQEDILNSYELKAQMKDIDVLVHLAAEVRSPYSYDDHSKYEQINQYGTLNVYQCASESSIQKVIYMSSAAVYGFHTIENESVTPQPENAYGKTKWQGEKYLQNLQNKEVIIFRLANVFGANPCLRRDAVINRFILEALIYKRIMIYGDGQQKRAFIYLPHVIEGLKQAIIQDTYHGIYNWVQGNASLNDIRDLLIEEIPDLEFTYVSASSHFRSLEMYSNRMPISQDLSEDIRKAYRQLALNFRLP